MKQYAILSIAILVTGLFVVGFLDQDSFGMPKPPPEKIKIDPPTYDRSFEIPVKVFLQKDISSLGYTVETDMVLFLPDGTPIRADLKSTDEVPPRDEPKEGGQNSRVHKLLVSIAFNPPGELKGVELSATVRSTLLDPAGTPVAGVFAHYDGIQV